MTRRGRWAALGGLACALLMLGQQDPRVNKVNARLNALTTDPNDVQAPIDLRAGTTIGGAPIGGGGSGEVNTASDLGGGLANFASKSGVDLRFNSFAAADFDLGSNLLTIDATKWLTIAAGNAAYAPVNPTLGTQTQGNFVASVATTAPLTGGAAGSEGGALTLGINQNAGTNVANDLEEEAHASEHQHGGGDEIASASPGANLIVKAGPTATIDLNWIPTTVATDAEVIAYAHPINTELTWLTTNCPLENDGTPIPDSCVGDGTDGGGGGGGAGYAEIAAAALAGF